jgi:hypothetical protein
VATVSGASSNQIIWEVNGVQGGNSSVGTISTNGLYQAPSSAPAGGSVTVRAVSTANSASVAAAVISILDTVTLSPASVTVITGATEQFTATVDGSSSAAVTWMVAGVAGGNAATGTISSTGLYTAPATVPTTAVSVTAVDASDTTASATVPVTVIVDPAIAQAQSQWLSGLAAAASTFGCTGISVQQQPTETVAAALNQFMQTANEGSCLALAPISTNPSSIRYSFAWGGKVNGIDIYYLSDVGQMRIWNGTALP